MNSYYSPTGNILYRLIGWRSCTRHCPGNGSSYCTGQCAAVTATRSCHHPGTYFDSAKIWGRISLGDTAGNVAHCLSVRSEVIDPELRVAIDHSTAATAIVTVTFEMAFPFVLRTTMVGITTARDLLMCHLVIEGQSVEVNTFHRRTCCHVAVTKSHLYSMDTAGDAIVETGRSSIATERKAYRALHFTINQGKALPGQSADCPVNRSSFAASASWSDLHNAAAAAVHLHCRNGDRECSAESTVENSRDACSCVAARLSTGTRDRSWPFLCHFCGTGTIGLKASVIAAAATDLLQWVFIAGRGSLGWQPVQCCCCFGAGAGAVVDFGRTWQRSGAKV